MDDELSGDPTPAEEHREQIPPLFPSISVRQVAANLETFVNYSRREILQTLEGFYAGAMDYLDPSEDYGYPPPHFVFEPVFDPLAGKSRLEQLREYGAQALVRAAELETETLREAALLAWHAIYAKAVIEEATDEALPLIWEATRAGLLAGIAKARLEARHGEQAYKEGAGVIAGRVKSESKRTAKALANALFVILTKHRFKETHTGDRWKSELACDKEVAKLVGENGIKITDRRVNQIWKDRSKYIEQLRSLGEDEDELGDHFDFGDETDDDEA